MTNPFEAYAQSDAIPGPTRRKMARAEARQPMVLSPMEKKLLEARKLFGEYRKYKTGIRKELLRRHGQELVMLLRVLRRHQPGDEDRLLGMVQNMRWIVRADEQTRHAVHGIISAALVRARLRDGRPHFDDPMPGKKSPELEIRKLLTGV